MSSIVKVVTDRAFGSRWRILRHILVEFPQVVGSDPAQHPQEVGVALRHGDTVCCSYAVWRAGDPVRLVENVPVAIRGRPERLESHLIHLDSYVRAAIGVKIDMSREPRS